VTKSLWLMAFLLGATAQGQVLIRVQQNSDVVQLPSTGTYTANAIGAGQAVDLWVTVTYTGGATLSFLKPPQLLGSPQFSISVAPPAVTVLAPNESASLQLRFVPANGNRVLAELDWASLESAPAAAGKPGLVVLGLAGTAPEYTIGYSLPSDGNISELENGATIPFPETLINAASTASVRIFNRGAGAGRVLSVAVSGEGFSPGSLPLLPARIGEGTDLPFTIRFQPLQPGAASGTLRVRYESGAEHTAILSGAAVNSRFTYQLLAPASDAVPILPRQTVTLPSVKLGEKTTVIVRVANSGTLAADLPSISVTGSAYQLSSLPALPARVQPAETLSFQIIFTPQDPARNMGLLRVADDEFDLSGEGLGARLEYRYGASAVLAGGQVPFPGTPLGQSATLTFQVSNTGTEAARLTSLGITADGKSAFTLVAPPALPLAVAAGATLPLTLRFSPLNPGQATALLRIEGDSFTLSATGNAPSSLPDYTITGPSSVLAFDQPSLGVTLASPYPVALSGTLALSVETEGYMADPAVQFASGGRNAAFTIPAGATRAVFGNGQNEIRFQVGTVAGAIVATPSFSTQSGYSLTPDSPRPLRMTQAATAPRLLSLQGANATSTGFTLIANGVANTRTIAKADVRFTIKPGFQISQTDFTVDLATSGYGWFQSTSSASFGGQFSVQIPFTLSTSDTATTAAAALSAIDSITFTVTNERGVSNSLTFRW